MIFNVINYITTQNIIKNILSSNYFTQLIDIRKGISPLYII